MIDLSHLTEEEQEAILTVLRRDADLKRAEEERVRKLEKILPSTSQPDAKLKYLTGEWFYEAKSRRHNDKIHGSEIILAAMKQGKTTSLDGSPRLNRSRTPGSRGSDITAPPKPARCFEMSEPQEKNDSEKENQYSGVRSPRMPRHNPFNRASLIVVDRPENIQDMSVQRDQSPKETEPVSSLKNPPAGDSSQTSGGSITSEGSSVSFRPVPKKRTLLLSRSQLQNNNQPLDAQVRPAEIVPAPRRRHQWGSGSNPPSCFKIKDEMPQEGVSNLSVQPFKAVEEVSLQPLCDGSQVSPNSSLERERNVTRDRPAAITRTEVTARRETASWNKDEKDLNQREQAASNVFNVLETLGRREELSSTQSSADPDPPVSYDLNFIDKSAQQRQKSNQKSVFKLSTQTPSPTGEDEDSIAKVLDWFDRSTDSNDWLDAEDESKALESADKHAAVLKSGGEDSFDGASKTKRRTRKGSEELTERPEDVWTDTIGKTPVQDVGGNTEENQPMKISNLKSFWEKSNTGPKVLFSKPERPGLNSDVPSDPERYSGRVTRDKSSSDLSDDREKQLLVDQLNDHQGKTLTFNSNQKKNSDSARLKLLHSSEISNRRAETSLITRPDTSFVEYQSDSVVKLKLQPESKQLLCQDLPTCPAPQLGTDPQTTSLDSEKLILSSQYVDYEQGGNEEQVVTEAKTPRGSSENKDKDKCLRGGVSNKECTNGQASRQQESTAEKIKQLKSFWEQELNKPVFYTGKSKALRGGKLAGQARLNKRFTKSEFDLTSVGNESGSDEEGGNKNTDFNVLPLSQRMDKLSPTLATSRAQFNTLREFWDETTSDSRGPSTPEKLKSSKKTEPLRVQLSTQELRSVDPELYPFSPSVVTKLYPSPKSRLKSPLDRAMRSESKLQNDSNYMPDESGQKKLSTRISKEISQEQISFKPQNSKEIRSPKSRKDSFSFSSSRGNSLRRATSLFALSVDDEKDQIQSESRKPRQKTDKGSPSRRSSDELETLAPRARAFVPTDYRHYLGMTDAALTSTVKDHRSEVKSGYELDLGGPIGASTPTSSEEQPVRTPPKMSQRPAWVNYSESDTGHESSISSASETWSNSRNCLNRVNNDDLNPVRKALWRAEKRPKNLAKSLEDVTAPPRQERRPDQTVDLRRSSIVLTAPSPSSSSFSDPDHLKKMSKSVPSFLEKEVDDGREDEGLTVGSSMTVLSGSSGTASLSGSVMTMYSGDFVVVQGSIQFSINYVQKLREFHIFVAECHNLAAVDPKRNRSDPYVKSYLVPDKANLGKRKTSVKKKTLNPRFNEILRYRVRMEYLRTQTLILSVWHHDTFGRNSYLGEVDVDLSKWDSDHTQMNYLALKAKTIPSIAPLISGRGEMRLALRFLPQITHSEGLTKDVSNTGEIHIWVKECKNLPLIRATIDPYVKCFVLPDTSRKSRQKTRVLRRTVDPVFNHTMVYDGISATDLSDVCVELTVWDRDRLASNLLGGLRLGAGTGRSYGALVDWMDSGPYEVTLWDRMITSPNEWVEDMLPLRILISARRVFK